VTTIYRKLEDDYSISWPVDPPPRTPWRLEVALPNECEYVLLMLKLCEEKIYTQRNFAAIRDAAL